MHLYSTSYHRASTVEDAGKVLSGAEDGKFIAGGQTLIAALKQQFALIGLCSKGLQAFAIGGEVKAGECLAAFFAMLVEQG